MLYSAHVYSPRIPGRLRTVNMRVRTCKELRAKHNQTSCCLRPPFLGTPLVPSTANLRPKMLDFRGFDSSIIFLLRGGIKRTQGQASGAGRSSARCRQSGARPGSLREMGGAPRNPAPGNHFLAWIVQPSGCHCTNGHLTSRVFTED